MKITREMILAGMPFFQDKKDPASKALAVFKAMIAAAPAEQLGHVHVHTVDCFVEGTQVCGMDRSDFERRHLGEPYRGNFFPKVPLLTDKQEREARAGACPTCHNTTLGDMGASEGLRFMGCCACLAVVVLDSRPDDRPLMLVQGRQHGRTHLAQQVKLAMTRYQEQESQAAGSCTRGAMCICHDSMPAVRFECRNWRKA